MRIETMRYFLAFLFAALAPFAAAEPADLTINFDAPVVGETQRPIDHYVLNQSCDTSPVEMANPVVDGQVLTAALETGNTYALCVTAVDVDGRVSGISNIETVTVDDIQQPNPPANFRIQVNCANCVITVEGQSQ